MGIPSYFSYIIKNYSNIIRNLGYFKNYSMFSFQHLYMDCNSIVYDAVRFVEADFVEKKKEVVDSDFEKDVIEKVMENIGQYIRMVSPTDTVFIAFDGVAPFAKMDQQRTRRHKSHYMSTINFGYGGNKKNSWNTSAITPGTVFMKKLSDSVEKRFIGSENTYRVKNVIVSCSNYHGEGEHKLFEHCRTRSTVKDNVAVYGLDADLIMLSIFHCKYTKNIYVFREAPEFLKSSIPIKVRGEQNEPQFLDISLLSNRILEEMKCKFPDVNRINDYIFMCFFLGNDFMPHFPAMNIRTHGIQAILDTYRLCMGNYQDRFFISTSGEIQWKNVGLFINELAKSEHELLMNEYFVRNKWDKYYFPEKTPKEREDLLTNAPVIFRSEEKYICPEEEMWESRYYKSLFGFERTSGNIKPLCENYLEGLEWVYKYYTNGCPDWKWKYNYNYPPLFSDLCKHVPTSNKNLIKPDDTRLKPFSPYTQLSYVLPYSNLHLLPNEIKMYLENNCAALYTESYDFQWAFCRYFWESHPLLPDISLDKLLTLDKVFTRDIMVK